MIFTDVVCPFCGCLCDDLEVVTEGNEVSKVVNACGISRSKFLNHCENRLSSPTVEGAEVGLDYAIQKAVEIVGNSKRLLVYGLSSTDCDAISKARNALM